MLFPNGIGTRGLIAFVVIGGLVFVAVAQRDVATLKEVALIVLSFYFAGRIATASAVRGG